MVLTGFLAATMAAAAAAAGRETERTVVTYLVEGRETRFFATEDFTLDAECEKKPGRYDCDAYRALARASRKLIQDRARNNGVADGPLICRALKGAVFIGRLPNGTENSFCKFRDGSLVSAASLAAAAGKNDNSR